MNISIRTSAILAGLFSLAFSSSAFAQTGIVWTDISGGTLAGSTATTSGFGSGNQILPYDLSGPYYSGAPLSTTQDCMDHHCNDYWTVNFTPPTSIGPGVDVSVNAYAQPPRSASAFPP